MIYSPFGSSADFLLSLALSLFIEDFGCSDCLAGSACFSGSGCLTGSTGFLSSFNEI